MMRFLATHPQWLKAKASWDSLSASEQRTLTWGASILLPILAYFVLWQPAHGALEKLHRNLPLLRSQLAQMKVQSDEVQSLRQRAQPAVADGAALKKVVEDAASREGWAAPALLMELTEQNDVRVVAESVSFSRWLHFLRELEATHHIRVATISISPSSAQGVVKVSGTLTSGAEQ